MGELLIKVLQRIERAASVGAAGIALLLAANILVQIVTRVFFKPVPGTFETGELMMVGIIFLALADAQAKRQHIAARLLIDRLPPSPKKVCDAVILLASLSIAIIITWQGGFYAYRAWATHEYIVGPVSYPLWPSKVMVPLGGGLLSLRFAVDFIRLLAGRAT